MTVWHEDEFMEKEIKECTDENISVCVDIDGEKRKFDLKEAATLCKDAYIFKSAKENYQRLVDFAKADNISVPELLDALEISRTEKRKKELVEKCGGSEEMALHILNLEKAAITANDNDAEFKKYFPNTDVLALPESVKISAQQNNRSLLDEYLRYRALLELNAENQKIKRKENEISSTGSMKNVRDLSFESVEFLKGLWR